MKRMCCLGVLVLVMMFLCSIVDAAEVLVRPLGVTTQMGDDVFVVQKPFIALVGGEKQVIEQGERLIVDRKENITIARNNNSVSVFSLDGSSIELIKAQEAPCVVNNPSYSQPREVVPKQSSSYPYGPYGPQKSNTTGWISTIFGLGLGGYSRSAERRSDYQTAGQLNVAGRLLVPAMEGRNPFTEGTWQDYEKSRAGGDVADAFGWTKNQNHHDNHNNSSTIINSATYPGQLNPY